MKKIGQGWQYTTYDIGDGRVYKKFHNIFRAYIIILSEIFPFKADKPWEIPGFIRDLRIFARSSKNLLQERSVPGSVTAQAKYVNDLNYTQDKIIPIKLYLESVDPSKQKEMINSYVHFARMLLDDYQMIDNSFNVANNFGVDNKGNIVLIDLGELQGDPEKIKQQIIDRVWARYYILMHLPSEEIKEYFVEKMNQSFLIENK